MATNTPIQNPRDLGELVRERRLELRMSQEDVANVARTGLRLVGEIESGKPTTQLEGLLRVLSALGIQLEAQVK